VLTSNVEEKEILWEQLFFINDGERVWERQMTDRREANFLRRDGSCALQERDKRRRSNLVLVYRLLIAWHVHQLAGLAAFIPRKFDGVDRRDSSSFP
jgi:hypothetical protein